jgi:hypothetical protein
MKNYFKTYNKKISIKTYRISMKINWFCHKVNKFQNKFQEKFQEKLEKE